MAITKDKITVRMLTRLAGIGKENEIVEVSRSQARNFLIPKGFAKEVNEKEINELKLKEEKRAENLRTLSRDRHDIAKNINGATMTFELNGVGTKIFGGLSELDIIEKAKHDFGIEFEKSHILLPEGKHIKTTGEHTVKIHLGEDVYIRLTVVVIAKAIK